MNSLQQLRDCGQSIWLDYIRRDLLTSGEFQRLVEEDGVHGITSNPTIFAFTHSLDELLASLKEKRRMLLEGQAAQEAGIRPVRIARQSSRKWKNQSAV
jgi:transaldolase